MLLSWMDEPQRRWFVAHESQRISFGGDMRMSRVTGLNVDTIARGRAELSQGLAGRPMGRVRLPGYSRSVVVTATKRRHLFQLFKLRADAQWYLGCGQK